MRVIIALLLLLFPVQAFAQSQSEGPVIDWLKKNDIAIRKTFDGKSKDESEAARVSYNTPNGGESFWLVDLGIKVKEWELCDCTGKLLRFYPIFEWHKTTNALETMNKVKFGPSLDVHVGDLTKKQVAFIGLFKAAYERDFLKDVSSGNVSLLAGIEGANKKGGGNTWLPMSHINDRGGNLVLRYAPYVGMEYYGNVAIEKKGLPTVPPVTITALALYLQVDFYPLNTPKNPGWLELTVSGVQRRKVAGDDAAEENLSFVSASLNVYFDRGRHFGIGADYEDGRNPKNNFDKQRSKSVALKLRF